VPCLPTVFAFLGWISSRVDEKKKLAECGAENPESMENFRRGNKICSVEHGPLDKPVRKRVEDLEKRLAECGVEDTRSLRRKDCSAMKNFTCGNKICSRENGPLDKPVRVDPVECSASDIGHGKPVPSPIDQQVLYVDTSVADTDFDDVVCAMEADSKTR